jgi:hypothetical protein
VNPGLGAAKALIAVVARSRDFAAASTAAVLSVAEYLGTLAHLGIVVQDIRRIKESMIAGVEARVHEKDAEALAKRATALKTMAEALSFVTNRPFEEAPGPVAKHPEAEAEAKVKLLLGTYAALGGSLIHESRGIERLDALFPPNVMPPITAESTVKLPLGTGHELKASVVGSASVSAELTIQHEGTAPVSSAGSGSASAEGFSQAPADASDEQSA